MKSNRVFVLIGAAALVVVMLIGCARLFWGTTGQSGWYIRLNIGDPGSKAISVEEYDVTQVDVGIFAPGETLPFYTLTWYAGDDPVSELIPVSEEGEYEIQVTQVADNNGEPVEAKESASFNIAAMVITVINVIPGAVGVVEVEPGEVIPEEPIDLTGYWTWFFTPDGDQEQGPITFGIQQQEDLTWITDLFDFIVSYDGSNFFLDSDTLDVHLTGEVAVYGDEIKITGTYIGEVLGGSGSGIFRIVPFPEDIFGTLHAEGTVADVPILIDTQYALGSPVEMENDPFPFSTFQVDGWSPYPVWVLDPEGVYLLLWLHVNGTPTETQYTWNDWWFDIEWESQSGNLEDYLLSGYTEGTLDITYYDVDVGIAGTFYAEGDDWGSLGGNFNVHFYDEWEPEGD